MRAGREEGRREVVEEESRRMGEEEVAVEAVSYAKKHALMISAGLYTPGTYIVRTRSQRES